MNRLRRLVLGAPVVAATLGSSLVVASQPEEAVAPGGGSVIHGSVGRNLLK